MRELDVKVITENIKEMCIEATHFLTEDMKKQYLLAANYNSDTKEGKDFTAVTGKSSDCRG